MNSKEETDLTWNVAFQPSLTETEQVEELMGLKENIKIMIFFFLLLNVVRINVTDSEALAGHAKPWLKIRS